MRCPYGRIGEVVQQRGLPDPAIAHQGTRLELVIEEPTADLFNLALPAEEAARIRDGVAVCERITGHAVTLTPRIAIGLNPRHYPWLLASVRPVAVDRPPLGSLGAGPDEAIVHWVAQAAIRALTDHIGAAIAKPVVSSDAGHTS